MSQSIALIDTELAKRNTMANAYQMNTIQTTCSGLATTCSGLATRFYTFDSYWTTFCSKNPPTSTDKWMMNDVMTTLTNMFSHITQQTQNKYAQLKEHQENMQSNIIRQIEGKYALLKQNQDNMHCNITQEIERKYALLKENQEKNKNEIISILKENQEKNKKEIIATLEQHQENKKNEIIANTTSQINDVKRQMKEMRDFLTSHITNNRNSIIHHIDNDTKPNIIHILELVKHLIEVEVNDGLRKVNDRLYAASNLNILKAVEDIASNHNIQFTTVKENVSKMEKKLHENQGTFERLLREERQTNKVLHNQLYEDAYVRQDYDISVLELEETISSSVYYKPNIIAKVSNKIQSREERLDPDWRELEEKLKEKEELNAIELTVTGQEKRLIEKHGTLPPPTYTGQFRQTKINTPSNITIPPTTNRLTAPSAIPLAGIYYPTRNSFWVTDAQGRPRYSTDSEAGNMMAEMLDLIMWNLVTIFGQEVDWPVLANQRSAYSWEDYRMEASRAPNTRNQIAPRFMYIVQYMVQISDRSIGKEDLTKPPTPLNLQPGVPIPATGRSNQDKLTRILERVENPVILDAIGGVRWMIENLGQGAASANGEISKALEQLTSDVTAANETTILKRVKDMQRLLQSAHLVEASRKTNTIHRRLWELLIYQKANATPTQMIDPNPHGEDSGTGPPSDMVYSTEIKILKGEDNTYVYVNVDAVTGEIIVPIGTIITASTNEPPKIWSSTNLSTQPRLQPGQYRKISIFNRQLQELQDVTLDTQTGEIQKPVGAGIDTNETGRVRMLIPPTTSINQRALMIRIQDQNAIGKSHLFRVETTGEVIIPPGIIVRTTTPGNLRVETGQSNIPDVNLPIGVFSGTIRMLNTQTNAYEDINIDPQTGFVLTGTTIHVTTNQTTRELIIDVPPATTFATTVGIPIRGTLSSVTYLNVDMHGRIQIPNNTIVETNSSGIAEISGQPITTGPPATVSAYGRVNILDAENSIYRNVVLTALGRLPDDPYLGREYKTEQNVLVLRDPITTTTSYVSAIFIDSDIIGEPARVIRIDNNGYIVFPDNSLRTNTQTAINIQSDGVAGIVHIVGYNPPLLGTPFYISGPMLPIPPNLNDYIMITEVDTSIPVQANVQLRIDRNTGKILKPLQRRVLTVNGQVQMWILPPGMFHAPPIRRRRIKRMQTPPDAYDERENNEHHIPPGPPSDEDAFTIITSPSIRNRGDRGPGILRLNAHIRSLSDNDLYCHETSSCSSPSSQHSTSSNSMIYMNEGLSSHYSSEDEQVYLTGEDEEDDEYSSIIDTIFSLDQEQMNKTLNLPKKKAVIITVPFLVKGKTVAIDCMIDTGATISVAKRWLFPESAWKKGMPITLRSVSNQVNDVENVANVEMILLENISIPVQFYELKTHSIDIIIGNNILEMFEEYRQTKTHVQLNYYGDIVTFPRKAEAIVHTEANDQKDVLDTVVEEIKEWLVTTCAASNPQAFWEKHQTYVTCEPNEKIKPFHHKPIPMNEKHRKQLKEDLDEWKGMGLIQEAATETNEYVSSAFYVNYHNEGKKRGKPRLVINYKSINDMIKPDKYPIPNKDALITEISKGSVFSTFHAKSGFYQIKMDPKCAKYFAFSTPLGIYTWKVMPMGYKYAPSVFQRYMDKIFSPQYDHFIRVYIDDIIIFSDNQVDHLNHLKEFGEVCQANGINISTKKIEMFKQQIDFLGLTINEGKIALQPHVLTKIADFPNVIKDKVQLQRLLVCLTYAESFIKNHAQKREPVQKLLKKGVQFEWPNEMIDWIKGIKEEVQQLPKIQLPQSHHFMILETDASNDCWGGILKLVCTTTEDWSNWEKATPAKKKEFEMLSKYCSGTFKGAEKNYPTYHKEILAAKKAMNKLNFFLTPKKFLLRTDCKVFKDIMQKNNLDFLSQTRILRWQQWFSQFEFDIEWIQGTSNSIADSPTREIYEVNTFAHTYFV